MSDLPVTLVTQDAAKDDLSEQDYKDIYVELRDGRSLRKFIEYIGSTASPSWWSQYEAGTKPLSWERKVELRRGVGYPYLPVSVELAVEQGVDPNAAVWKVGSEDADRVILVGADAHEPLYLRVNSHLTIIDAETLQGALSDDAPATSGKSAQETNYDVTPVTSPQTCIVASTRRLRRKAHRPYIERADKWAAYLAWSAEWDAEHEAA